MLGFFSLIQRLRQRQRVLFCAPQYSPSIVPDSIGQNKSLGDLNVLSPSLPKSRKRSITELNPELNPLAKSAPSRNSSKRPGKILIETDL